MPQNSGIFNSTRVLDSPNGFPRGDKAVDAEFLAHSKRLYYKNGVFPNPSTNFQVMAHQNMTVKVRPGACFIDGYEAWDDEVEYLTVPVSSSAQTAYVAQRLTLSPPEDAGISKVLITAGAGGATPVRNSDIYEIFLAKIALPASSTAITDAMITDLRMDGEVCGIVSGGVSSVDTTTLSKQYQSWFESVVMNLDEEAAGHLLNMITGITDLQSVDVPVPSGLWIYGGEYAAFPYRADIPIPGAAETMIPGVILGVAQASEGVIAPYAESLDGHVRIFAREIPASFTIPVIRLKKAV